MQQKIPAVSVIVPCYNAEGTIERCLNAILAQTVPVAEILVYDDCSQDGSAVILARMAAKHGCIRVITGTENKGAGFARNTLLQEVQGEYLAFLDADDTWYPKKLEKQLDLMAQTKADLCVCSYEVVDHEGKVVGSRVPPRNITRLNMHLANWMPTSMSVVKARLNGCREMPAIRPEDYAYNLGIFARNPGVKCVSVPETLGTYYRMPGSASSNMVSNLKANYRMFRQAMGYSMPVSGMCVVANVITRVIRI